MRWNSIIRRYVYTFSFCKYYIIQEFTFQHIFIRLVRLCMIVSVIKPYKFVFIIDRIFFILIPPPFLGFHLYVYPSFTVLPTGIPY